MAGAPPKTEERAVYGAGSTGHAITFFFAPISSSKVRPNAGRCARREGCVFEPERGCRPGMILE